MLAEPGRQRLLPSVARRRRGRWLGCRRCRGNGRGGRRVRRGSRRGGWPARWNKRLRQRGRRLYCCGGNRNRGGSRHVRDRRRRCWGFNNRRRFRRWYLDIWRRRNDLGRNCCSLGRSYCDLGRRYCDLGRSCNGLGRCFDHGGRRFKGTDELDRHHRRFRHLRFSVREQRQQADQNQSVQQHCRHQTLGQPPPGPDNAPRHLRALQKCYVITFHTLVSSFSRQNESPTDALTAFGFEDDGPDAGDAGPSRRHHV